MQAFKMKNTSLIIELINDIDDLFDILNVKYKLKINDKLQKKFILSLKKHLTFKSATYHDLEIIEYNINRDWWYLLNKVINDDNYTFEYDWFVKIDEEFRLKLCLKVQPISQKYIQIYELG